MSTKKFILSAPVDPVRAIMRTDDGQYEIHFDATEYFAQASDDELLRLAECGWAGDYPADDVAEYFDRPQNPRMREAFREKEGGFEVRVHDGDAMAWLRRNRPTLYAAIAERIEPMDDDWEDWKQTE